MLVHLFQVFSSGDYMSHLRLWDYLIARMREDLRDRAGVCWSEDW